ncbi:MAG: hypothetical protein LBM74_10425 [Oscillospiraceae bacterium]|jgi:hypothetical protein|nr:hypothetical protein [Oscillospiraceae bacterium]
MISDALYDLAFQFSQTKLWKKLYDSQLFAVRHADGSIGYCCVMGMMSEYMALAVYPGEEGLDTYRKLGLDRSKMRALDAHENALAQHCAMVAFENKGDLRPREKKEVSAYCAARGLTPRGRRAYPQFQQCRPHCLPWYLDDPDDQAHLAEALEAAIEVDRRLATATPEALGFTEGPPFDRTIPLLEKIDGAYRWGEMALPEPLPVAYPSPDVADDLSAAKLAKITKRGGEWVCDVFMHMEPILREGSESLRGGEPKDAPFFPYLLLVLDSQTGMILSVETSKGPEEYAQDFAQVVIQLAVMGGKPARILVSNERAYALFARLAERMGAKLVMKPHIPLLEEIEMSFLERFSQEASETDDDKEQMLEILSDPKTLSEMPDALLIQLAQMAEMGGLPDGIVRLLQRECTRRGIPL